MKKRRALKSYYITRYFSSVVAGNAPPLARGPRADFSGLRRCVKRSIIEFQRKHENASEKRLGKGGGCSRFSLAAKVRNPGNGSFSSPILSVARRGNSWFARFWKLHSHYPFVFVNLSTSEQIVFSATLQRPEKDAAGALWPLFWAGVATFIS